MKKKTSLSDIARALGVSKTLVSMVLNGKGDENGINEETQKKVLAKARELNYKPNMMARSLRIGRSNTLGLIVADISNSFYARMCRAVEDAASKRGYYVFFGSSDENPKKENNLIQMLRDRQVDGLLLSTTLNNNETLREMVNEQFPFVLVDRFVPGLEAPFVTADNFGGSVQAVDHLVSLGLTRIAQITISPSHLTTMTERTRGYRSALEKHRIPFDANLVREIPFDDVQTAIRREVADLVRPPHNVQALFVLNNNLAMATLGCLNEIGLRIPEDISLISFDDVDMFRFCNPPLTAVAQPVEEMGVRALNLLLDRVEKERKSKGKANIFLETELIPRQSCGSFAVKP